MFKHVLFRLAILEKTLLLHAHQKQRAVIEFLALEGELPPSILKRLPNVDGEPAIGYSAVKKWGSSINGEEQAPDLSDHHNKQRSGRTSSAVNPGSRARVEALTRK